MTMRVTPILVYDDIQAAHDFLIKAFSFESGGIERDSEGQPFHAELRAGDTAIWLHRVADEHQLASQKAFEAASSGLAIRVDDVNSHCDHARTAGAHIQREPQDMPYGLREYEARDPEGHRWWFASTLTS